MRAPFLPATLTGFLSAGLLSIVMGLALAGAAFALQPDEVLDDAGLEARARAISADVRCMVCQNQSIDDSDAPLARDLRLLVRERLKAGDSDAQVFDFLVARYGEFVLLKPRLTTQTALLWASPLLLFATGALLLGLMWRRRRPPRGSAVRLSDEERARVDALLRGE